MDKDNDADSIGCERRKFSRFYIEVPVKVATKTQIRQGEAIHLLTSDISAGGAFLCTHQAFPEGTQVELDIILGIEKLKKLMDSKCLIIKTKAIVVRSGKTGMAVSFHESYRMMPMKSSPN